MFNDEEIWQIVENFLKEQEDFGSDDEIGKLLKEHAFYSLKEIEPVEELVRNGKPVWKIKFTYLVVDGSETEDLEFSQYLIIDQNMNIVAKGRGK